MSLHRFPMGEDWPHEYSHPASHFSKPETQKSPRTPPRIQSISKPHWFYLLNHSQPHLPLSISPHDHHTRSDHCYLSLDQAAVFTHHLQPLHLCVEHNQGLVAHCSCGTDQALPSSATKPTGRKTRAQAYLPQVSQSFTSKLNACYPFHSSSLKKKNY